MFVHVCVFHIRDKPQTQKNTHIFVLANSKNLCKCYRYYTPLKKYDKTLHSRLDNNM